MMGAPPAGYLRVTAGRCTVITRESHEVDARTLLADGTLYEAAARDLAARPLAGRGTAYSIVLPASGSHVVVRHNRHGGFLAPLTRDLFLPPTRAPHELAVSRRLADAGVRTPPVIMYGLQTTALVFRRADVMTLAIGDSRDLSTYMLPGEASESRAEAWAATRALVEALVACGAYHHDLNVKNILLAREDGALTAWVLDVDRVAFGIPHSARVRGGNAARLLRSARKWRDVLGAELDERELAALGAARPSASLAPVA